ncbi:hypothetical protein [Spiroplasma ixodetis]|uniref:hypothetical protein n=1 Tax=Spiroplasma ixodetis TaxID=2141 RepID=UPI0025787B6B|nr:hypothetical protein [Spiroplasma ixodetis]WJG70141.1 hypothetical protein SIXOD_v1c11930 [Spiroplasma ixodetis Y32]
MDNYIVNKITKFYLGGNIQQTTQKEIILDKLTLNDSVEIKLFFNKNEDEITITSNNNNYQTYISAVYQFQGQGIPTEFIAEENIEHDYYTKQETNELLDKKQDKLIAGENIKIDEKTNTISANGESLWEIDPNRQNIIQPKEKRIITSNNTRIVDIADPTQP